MSETARTRCPDCGSLAMGKPDDDGWQMCHDCGTDFAPDYQPGDDD